MKKRETLGCMWAILLIVLILLYVGITDDSDYISDRYWAMPPGRTTVPEWFDEKYPDGRPSLDHGKVLFLIGVGVGGVLIIGLTYKFLKK